MTSWYEFGSFEDSEGNRYVVEAIESEGRPDPNGRSQTFTRLRDQEGRKVTYSGGVFLNHAGEPLVRLPAH